MTTQPEDLLINRHLSQEDPRTFSEQGYFALQRVLTDQDLAQIRERYEVTPMFFSAAVWGC